MFHRRLLPALEDRGPLRVMFVITSMPVGGAETLLTELVRRLDRTQFLPEICCLKERGPLGEELAREVPVFCRLVGRKWDPRVLWRLTRLLRGRRIDAVITVGAGDKMFWGRLAARWLGLPVIAAALHSTGMPDRVGWLNRRLAPITDAFIAVAESHGRYLAAEEGCPADKVRVIPNCVDTERFHPRPPDPALRSALGLAPDAPVAGILAALRPEKNHALFLRAAALVRRHLPQAQFLVIGDGPRRAELELLAQELGIGDAVHFLGSRSDVPELLGLVDVMLLTSHMEASPVSILEAMAAGKPVVATRVGSVAELVLHGQTGYLVESGAAEEIAGHTVELLRERWRAAAMGRAARERVLAQASVGRMVAGYEQLISGIYRAKSQTSGSVSTPVASVPPAETPSGLGLEVQSR